MSVERIAQLDDDDECPQEQYATAANTPRQDIVPLNPANAITTGSLSVTNDGQVGQIEFRDVYLRYRKNLPYALKGVSFVVKPQSKVSHAYIQFC